jgi:hypothetical protein
MRRIFSATAISFLLLGLGAAGAAYLANKYVKDAKVQRDRASEAAALADNQTRVAQAASDLAKQKTSEAVEAQRLSDEKKRDADKWAHLATAQELATHSTAALESDPELGIALAMHSANATKEFGQSVSPAAERALHNAILTSPFRGSVALQNSGPVRDLKEMLFPSAERHVTGISYTPDGRRLASVSGDKRLRLWDSETRRELQHIGHDEFLLQGFLSVRTGACWQLSVLNTSSYVTLSSWPSGTGYRGESQPSI